MNVHVQSVAAARETGKLGCAHLAAVRGVDGFAVARQPLADFREDANGALGDCAVGLRTDIQKIVPAIARTLDEISNNRLWALPIVVSLLVAPAVIQRHAAFPSASFLLRDNFLFRRGEVAG